MIIVDTSIAAKWVVQEAGSDLALALLDRDEPLIAPDRMLPELVSVLRRKLKSGQISQGQLLNGVREVSEALDQFIASVEIAIDAALLSLELDHSPYDCFFLASALSRGVLVTADEAFARKCFDQGYGNVVVALKDMESGRLDAALAFEQVDPDTIADIRRLVPLVKRTFEALQDKARSGKSERFHFISAEDVRAGFSSPTYKALERGISGLSSEQLTLLLALGWLGRSYYSGSDWPRLLANARQGSLSGNFNQHRAYIMAQMNTVPEGLAKLQVHYGIQE